MPMLETIWQYTWMIGDKTLAFALETAPWLLLGLSVAGLLKAYIPDRVLHRWVGGKGFGAIGRAAVLGAPLPLCSCGVIPAAIGLRRQGASPGGTISFLIATPETGVDSVAVSYVLLGPFLAIVRPIAAIISAVSSGLACQWIATRYQPYPGAVGGGAPETEANAQAPSHSQTQADGAAGGSGCDQNASQPMSLSVKADDDCCGETKTDCCEPSSAKENADQSAAGSCCGGAADKARSARGIERLRQGMRYAANDLLDEIWLWMGIGLIAAGAVSAFLGQSTLEAWGSGLPAMLLMLVIGVPMYICATASTPLAAAMLLAGVSPGTVLVFLLAGPATNLATVGLVRREMGTPVVIGYLGSMGIVTIALGLATDALLRQVSIDILAQKGAAAQMIPTWLMAASLVLLVLLMIRPLRKAVL